MQQITAAQRPYTPPPEHDLKTIYADDAVIVADKPSGLLSVPGRGPEKAICAQSVLADRHGRALTVHRLDMDTSGLLVFATSKDVQRHLSIAFQNRQVEKVYEALVEGIVADPDGHIDLAIAKFSKQRPLRHLDPEGLPARTGWTVVERLETCTRVALYPETGRSHQLRLHMKAIGHPILGDAFYGTPKSAPRLCLHARQLTFSHPITEEIVSFATSTPF